MDIEKLHSLFLKCSHACTDTRSIQKNDMFFALKGPNFNGNSYAVQALQKGASYAVIDDKAYLNPEIPQILLVEDSLNTLQELARYHRQKLGLKIISLTGSNGKTTTKELINAVLSQKYTTVATKGNLNNHIGVPLTLLSMNEQTEIGVVEMGANHLKEIEFLCKIAQPEYGYITNFGKAHLEGFGSIEGVIKGKSELYEYLINNDKTVFINADDQIQVKILKDYNKKFSYGTNTAANQQIELLNTHPFVSVKTDSTEIETQLVGVYNFHNIAAAISIGKYFNVPLEKIKQAIKNYVPDNNRSQIIKRGNKEIILDAYNANPSSMKAALDNFSVISDKSKAVILGDMFEVGITAAQEHQDIANYALKKEFKEIFLIGENFNKVDANNTKKFKSYEDFKNYLTTTDLKVKYILIKGSRGMALERILTII